VASFPGRLLDITEVRPVGEEPAYPLQHSLSVYLALTGGRGSGEGRIVMVNADTGKETYTGQAHTIRFPSDPLKVIGVSFRITSCSFPEPGLYWVEFRYNDLMVARQPLLVR
jgi:hypothetical protein